nr:glycosyltransferase family 2 protein [Gymnodinialimonas phycosphaerae]
MLVHNEAHLLPDLFAHYRAMGSVQYVVIDDRSTDTTRAIVQDQPDVTLFEPLDGSTYARDKRDWRGSLLDALASGKWCVVIDADERLVWRGYPERTLSDLIATMEAQGAQALIATMLDMYADTSIADHVSHDAPLAKTFPCYDDPQRDPLAYRAALTPKRFRQKFPLPNSVLMGGMRDRLFDASGHRHSYLTRLLQSKVLTRPRHVPDAALLGAALVTRLTRPRGDKPPLNLTKVPLVKWRTGLRYNGGAHHLSANLPLAHEAGVLLHFPVTRGLEGIAYLANRGQHASGGGYYRSILESGALSDVNPVYAGTSTLTDIAQLEPFFGKAAP